MVLAQQALWSRDHGELTVAADYTRRAYALESEAAGRIAKEPRSEPTRSILYRSAASLAYQANEFTVAQRLVFEGLSGYPPPTIEQELRDLYDQLNFARHAQVHGITLGQDGVQLALAGDAVATGQVIYNVFRKRSEAIVNIFDRTMRRMMGQPYQKGGTTPDTVRPFQPVITTPMPGSFAVVLQLLPRLNQQLPLGVTGRRIINDAMTNIDLLQRDQTAELQGRFTDERYYRNFVSQAKLLAPDEDGVNLVGLTTVDRIVEFTRKTNDPLC